MSLHPEGGGVAGGGPDQSPIPSPLIGFHCLPVCRTFPHQINSRRPFRTTNGTAHRGAVQYLAGRFPPNKGPVGHLSETRFSTFWGKIFGAQYWIADFLPIHQKAEEGGGTLFKRSFPLARGGLSFDLCSSQDPGFLGGGHPRRSVSAASPAVMKSMTPRLYFTT